jgi:hypothetical protein
MDVAKHLIMYRTVPQQRIMQPKMSRVQRLRNPAVSGKKIPGSKPTPALIPPFCFISFGLEKMTIEFVQGYGTWWDGEFIRPLL